MGGGWLGRLVMPWPPPPSPIYSGQVDPGGRSPGAGLLLPNRLGGEESSPWTLPSIFGQGGKSPALGLFPPLLGAGQGWPMGPWPMVPFPYTIFRTLPLSRKIPEPSETFRNNSRSIPIPSINDRNHSVSLPDTLRTPPECSETFRTTFGTTFLLYLQPYSHSTSC